MEIINGKRIPMQWNFNRNGILTAMEASNFECVMAKFNMKSDYLTFLPYYQKIFISNPIRKL